MKYILLMTLGLFVLTACNEDKENELRIKTLQEEKARLELSLKQKDALLLSKKSEMAKKDAILAKQANALERIKIQKEKEKKEALKNNKLSELGINIKNKTITIDTNKTKDFFETIEKSLENKITKLTTDLEKGIVDTKENGIDINDQHINIDLNKTRNLLETWGKKMQGFVKDFDDVADSMNIK